VSQQRPAGTPTIQESPPNIQVVMSPALPAAKGVAVWVLIVVALVAFGLGLSLGLILR
jgi:hypothetical protein